MTPWVCVRQLFSSNFGRATGYPCKNGKEMCDFDFRDYATSNVQSSPTFGIFTASHPTLCIMRELYVYKSYIGFEVLIAGIMKSSVFWDITSCSLLEVNQHLGRPCRQKSRALATCFMVVTFLTYSSILKMEATCSSEKSVDFHWTTRRYIPED
jgi:hypothetical protein